MVNVTEKMKSEFDALICETEKQAESNSNAEMIITVKTAKGNTKA